MRAVSDNFLNAIRGAHKAVFRATIVNPGQTGVTPIGTEVLVGGGTVNFSTTSDVNATLDLTAFIDWPGAPTSLGAPYGQEVFVERGVQYANGTKEYVGLGYFRIDQVEQDSTPNGSVRITGSDRMANVRDGRNSTPVQFSTGASVGAVIDFAVGEVVPGLVSVYDFDAYNTFLTSDHILDEDRLKFVTELVQAYGKVAYFDYSGKLRVKTPPAPNSVGVYAVNAGRDGVLVSMKRTISRDGVYNAVVARGEPAGEQPPVQAIAYDADPKSPTVWGGPFGKVPRFFSSSFMTTPDQCMAAATQMLLSARGVPYAVNLGAVPNPALEGWDVIFVVYSDTQNSETHIIDTISYSLDVGGAVGIDTRKQYLY